MPADQAGGDHAQHLLQQMTASLSLAFLHSTGGGDFFMASKHGVYVHGVDLSVNMVTTALERAFCRQRWPQGAPLT